MTDAASFAKLVPGFDFLQGLVKNAGSAMPNMGQWIAPTLDPVELDRRIQELKTVQFWLEQNARMISTTVQALEVQRMTLATLQGMNVSVGSLQEAMQIKAPPMAAAAPAPAPAPAAPLPQGDEDAPPAGVVDPMQWWNALTQQFTQLASNAMQAAGEAAQAAQSAAQTAAQTAASAATATANATVAAAAAAAAPAAEAAAAKKVSKATPRKRAA